MDFTNFYHQKQNLHLQALSEMIEKNGKQIIEWTNFQKQYEKVLEGLNMLPLELSVNCMIPIGKQALIKGKLKHTNEILVSLGEGYFVNYTAAQAIELTKRRIKRTQEIIEFFNKERSLLDSRQNCISNYGPFEDTLRDELIEHWSEEDLTNWRIKHRQREKEYNENKSEKEHVEKKYITTEEELFRRLDELELEEELADEYYRSQADNIDEDDEDDEDDDEEDDEEEEDDDDDDDENNKYSKMNEKEISKDLILEKPNNHSESNTQTRRVSFKDTCDETIADIKEVCSESKESDIEKCSDIRKKVNYDQDSNIVPKINFTHSNIVPQLPDNVNTCINNPGEISIALFQPKSILKRPRDNLNLKESDLTVEEYSLEKYLESDIGTTVFEDIVTETVQEKKQDFVQPEILEPVSNKKPISRFKKQRANK